MSRKKKKIYRYIFPDRIFNSIEISKFINIIMISGNKNKSSNILYKTFEYIKNITKKNPLKIFSKAINNISPMLEIKSKKIGNYNTLVPIEISDSRRITLSMRWLKNISRNRKEKKMYLKLGNEIIEAYNKKGLCFKKKYDLQKVSNSNKSYNNFNKKNE